MNHSKKHKALWPVFSHKHTHAPKSLLQITHYKSETYIILSERPFQKMHTKNSYAHYLKVGEFGYFQVLEDEMSYFDGQDACQRIKGKIIECNERHGNASSNFFYIFS